MDKVGNTPQGQNWTNITSTRTNTLRLHTLWIELTHTSILRRLFVLQPVGRGRCQKWEPFGPSGCASPCANFTVALRREIKAVLSHQRLMAKGCADERSKVCEECFWPVMMNINEQASWGRTLQAKSGWVSVKGRIKFRSRHVFRNPYVFRSLFKLPK